jgi:hypothetical protein
MLCSWDEIAAGRNAAGELREIEALQAGTKVDGEWEAGARWPDVCG